MYLTSAFVNSGGKREQKNFPESVTEIFVLLQTNGALKIFFSSLRFFISFIFYTYIFLT